MVYKLLESKTANYKYIRIVKGLRVVGLDKTDQTLMSVSIALVLACLVIFITITEKGLFFYLFGAILLLIFVVVCIVMAGVAYSMRKEREELCFFGKNSLVEQFCKMSEQDMTFLMGVIIFLVVVLLVLNSIGRYAPFFNQ